MRVLLADFMQETSHFNPLPTTRSGFNISRGEELIHRFANTNQAMAGALDVFSHEGIDVVPTCSANSVTSGGPVLAYDLDSMTHEMLAEMSDVAPTVDGVYFSFHGAMAGYEEHDPEGRILEQVRAMVGDKPIVTSYDLHGILTDRQVRDSDVMVALHTYPHTDMRETGQRAARCLVRLLRESARPVVAQVKLPMLVRGDELITATGLLGQAIARCKDFEASAAGLSALVNIGNPFTDVPELRTNTIVSSDGDAELAKGLAEELAEFMWRHRERMQAQLVPVPEAIQLAEQTDGLTVFSDAADATSSGASGDSNWILKGLIDSQFCKRALLPLVDAPVVEEAFSAGVGRRFTAALGGKVDTDRHRPVDCEVYVQSLHDGHFRTENGTWDRAGRTAVLVTGKSTVMVTEFPVSIMGRRVFESRGLNPVDFDLVVCKSPNGFRTYYESICQRIVAVDCPGSTSANLRSLPYTNVTRPIFPLDEHVSAEIAATVK
ncbi:MAG: M81 family metallopeptidase [Candidatus Latescibacterota bacterium]|nr:M81 family metallopeptidase [Candidatus Latescibacterota bacterium]